MQKRKVIFNRKIANYLISKGHRLKYIDVSHKDQHQLIFIFDETEKLEKDMTQYFNDRKNKAVN